MSQVQVDAKALLDELATLPITANRGARLDKTSAWLTKFTAAFATSVITAVYVSGEKATNDWVGETYGERPVTDIATALKNIPAGEEWKPVAAAEAVASRAVAAADDDDQPEASDDSDKENDDNNRVRGTTIFHPCAHAL